MIAEKNTSKGNLRRVHCLWLALLLAGLAVAPGLADASGGGPANTAWPMFQHDRRHTGQSPYLGAQDNTTRWAYPTNSGFKGAAAIGGDGTIYFNSYGTNMKLFAINPDGSLKWSRDTSHSYGTPAIGSDGTIYVATVTQFYAYNPDGSLKWSFSPPQTIYGSPVIGDDGTVYYGADGGGTAGSLYAIRDNGTSGAIKWSYPCGKISNSAPAIGNGGTIYIGTVFNNLHAVTDAGDHAAVKWVLSTNGSMRNCPPAIGADGTIYIGSDNSGSLYAITDNFTNPVVKWRYDTGWSIQSSPAIGSNGTIYVGCSKAAGSPYSLHAINPDGSRKWAFDAGDDTASSSPVVGSDGTIYIGNGFENTVKAIGDNGTDAFLKWSYLTGSWLWGSPAIASDGTVYIGSYDSNFYAFNNRPMVTLVNPNSGTQGQTLNNVIITGCQFTGATIVSFGAGITVNSFNTDNATQITANITIAPGATPGARNVTLTTPKGTGTKISGFTVIALPPSPPTPGPQLIGTGAGSPGGSSGSVSSITSTQPVVNPTFIVQSASLSSSQTSGGPVTVQATVANTSTVNGVTRVRLYVNGQLDSEQAVTVTSGKQTPVSFTVSRNEPGTYQVYVNGTSAGSFTVSDNSTILYISIAFILLAFILGIILIYRKATA